MPKLESPHGNLWNKSQALAAEDIEAVFGFVATVNPLQSTWLVVGLTPSHKIMRFDFFSLCELDVTTSMTFLILSNVNKGFNFD